MIFYYLRHGDPIYSPDGLTPLGTMQADALAKRLCRYGIDEIYSSSSNRAQLTAEPTCRILNKNMTILDWCNESYAWDEFSLNSDKGRTWVFNIPEKKQILTSGEVNSLGQKWYTHPAFKEGNFERGLNRITKESDAFFTSLGYEHDHGGNIYRCVRENNSRVALFAHQGFGLIFLSCLLDIPYPLFCTHFDILTTGMTVIDFKPDDDGTVIPRVIQHSGDSHLYREGLPTVYGGEYI